MSKSKINIEELLKDIDFDELDLGLKNPNILLS